MAVKWIGEAAAELGMDVFEAVALLASKQNYPMNGLLDEDRVQLLKRYRVEATHPPSAALAAPQAAAPVVPAPPAPEPPAEGKGRKGSLRGREDVTSVTSPFPTQDKAEERTVIIPPPLPDR